MARQFREWDRFSTVDGEQTIAGRTFKSLLGEHDLSNVRVLHAGLDTVKQLYRGRLRQEILLEIERVYDEGFGECIELAGHPWLVGSGGQSGYQFRLQNSDVGLILFVKSRYSERDQDYSHLKIECSPHWLVGRTSADMMDELNSLAKLVLLYGESSGCAAHICVDVQGWEPPVDIADRMVTYARRMRSHDAMKITYMDLGEICVNHDKGQSYLWGSPSTVQFALYRKDIQAKAIDKMDFWREVWGRATHDLDRAYDSAVPVWRLELRFHHSVMAEIGEHEAERAMVTRVFPDGVVRQGLLGTDPRKACATLVGVMHRMGALWRYGLDSFRLENRVHGKGRYIDPHWQFFRDDARLWFIESLYKGAIARKRKTPGDGNEKNVALAFGNWLSICARSRYTPRQAWDYLKRSGIYDDVFYMMQRRAWADYRTFDESEILDAITKGLQKRTLLGKAA
jgi:hypothetical protein